MIDWWWVARGALWIGGLSILLATASYRSWQGAVLRKPSPRSGYFYDLGLALFALGLLASSTGWLERAGWTLVLALVAWQVLGRLRAARQPVADRTPGTQRGRE